MEKLLAMILTAYDPRRNPVAGLLLEQASQSWRSLVQLFESEGTRSGPTENYYTTNHMEPIADLELEDTVEAVAPSGRVVRVRPAISL